MMKRRGHSRGQRFVKADYYELDWYYDECTDGKVMFSWRFPDCFMSWWR